MKATIFMFMHGKSNINSNPKYGESFELILTWNWGQVPAKNDENRKNGKKKRAYRFRSTDREMMSSCTE